MNDFMLAHGICAKCGKDIKVFGDLKDSLCIPCDEEREEAQR